MGLGHILLYPQRLEEALEAGPQKQRFDNAADGVLTLLGAGTIGSDVSQALWERMSIDRRAADYFGPWFAAGGPFAGLKAKAEGNFENFDKMIVDLLDTLKDTPPSSWRVVLQRRAELAIDLLAPVDLSALVTFLRRELEGVINTLKRPVRNGPRSMEAHRALRSAVALRRMLRPAFAMLDDAEDALRSLNLKAQLRLAIGQLFDLMQGPNLDRLQLVIQMFDESFGTVLRASAGFRVDVTVDVDIGGPQGATEDSPASRFEAQAVPNPKPDAIWTTDLVTNIFASFSLLWELIRTAAFAQRPLDGIMMLLGLIWQISRTVVRAGFAEKVNVAMPAQGMPEFDAKNWFFTDQADFAMNIVWRLLGSLHEHHAKSNWYLSVTRRWMGYISHVTQWRMPYQFARSLSYAMALGKESGSPEAAPSRLLMLALPVGWFVGMICAICVPWEDFQLENMSGAVIASIVIVIAFFVAALFLMPLIFIGRVPSARLDRMTNIVLGAAAVLGALITALLVGELEFSTGKEDLQTAIIVILIVVLIMATIGTVITMFEQSSNIAFYIQAILLGLLASAVLFFLWYFYFDDGRDKPGVYDSLDAENSPFKLPYDADDNWLCGQGSHGIFSHYPVAWDNANTLKQKSDNHYAIDFNHIPRVPGLVARDGIVMNFREERPDDKDEPNSVGILHTRWSPAVDPGTDEERVLTFSEYLHISQGSVQAELGDRVVQGNHIVNIDNNGRSAQHHLHFHSNTKQGQRHAGGRQETNHPIVFSDDSTRWFRNYPLLVIIPGKGHVPGKPLSMAFYVSSNERKPKLINPRCLPFVPARLAGAAVDHSHDLLIDSVLLGGAIPDTITLKTSIAQGHSHDVTLSRAQIEALLDARDPAGLATADSFGHVHDLAPLNHLRQNASAAAAPTFKIAQPPGAFMTTSSRAPHQVAGSRWVLRGDRSVTEFHDHLASPARFVADIAVDLGLANGEKLSVDGVEATLDPATGRLPVREVARSASSKWMRADIPKEKARPTALALPVLVIETRHGGSAASLELAPATAMPFIGALPPIARGSGVVPDGRAVSVNDLAALLNAGLTSGQPMTAGVTLAKASIASELGIAIGGAAATFTGGSTRLDRVLDLAYDSAGSKIPSIGTLPLNPGRFGLAGISVPILGREASHRFPVAQDAFAAANLTATPLVLRLRGVAQNVAFQSGDTTATLIARRINLQAEGVRASDEGGDIIVETIDGGTDATIAIEKKLANGDPGLRLAALAGTSPTGNGLVSCSAIALAQLARQIELAQAAATLPYDPAVVTPAAIVNGDRIVVSVGAGHTISIDDFQLAGPSPAFTFTPVATPGVQLQTEPIAGPVRLLGMSWVDFLIDGARVRVPLDTERARLELPLLSDLPRAGDRLAVAVNGAAPVEIVFDGTQTSIAAVAELIAAGLADCTVRLSYRLALRDAFRGEPPPPPPSGSSVPAPVSLTDSTGLKQMGFLRPVSATDIRRIGFLTKDAKNRDGLALMPDDPAASAAWQFAAPPTETGDLDLSILTIADGGPGAAFTLSTTGGWQIACTRDAGGDPFGLAAAAPSASIVSSVGGATYAWNGTALRMAVKLNHPVTNQVGGTQITLHAQPAVLQGVRGVTPLMPGTRHLTIEVQSPGGAARSYDVDLSPLDLVEALPGLETEVAAATNVAAAINAAVPGVRAWVVDQTASVKKPTFPTPLLHIETEGAGSGWRLRAGPLELAGLLGLAVENAAAGAATLEASGTGDVADAAAVTRAELLAMFERAARLATVRPGPVAARSAVSKATTAAIAANVYGARSKGAEKDLFMRLESKTVGLASSLQCIEHAGRGPAFPTDEVQAPACRASVVIPPFSGPLTLNGDLPIEFNAALPASTVLAPTLVSVSFPNGSYTAQQIADRINAAIAPTGVGTARLFPDGAIVVETQRAGTLGAVNLPAAGPTRAVADVLLGAGISLAARGWPDAGSAEAGKDLLAGFAGRRGAAASPAEWRLESTKGNVTIQVAVNDTPDKLAEKLNQQFALAGANQIGVAGFFDGILFIESTVDPLTLKVNGAELKPVDPDQDRPWLTPERALDPSCDLRRTAEIRTVRVARSHVPDFDPAALDDWGWLRHPIDSASGDPVTFIHLPLGRYGVNLRSDGGKASANDAAVERVAAASATSELVYIVRFGISVTGGTPWGYRRLQDGSLVEEWTFS
jgi:hypothetical protein